MKAELKIKREILRTIYPDRIVQDSEIETVWEEATEAEVHYDALYEFRDSGDESKIPCNYSRHYESESRARKLSDGSWVGWTFWYGGGKHGNPEEIDWMDSAYELKVTEAEKTVIVKTYEKIKP